MKLKKLFAAMLAGVMALGTMAFVTACGEPDPGPDPTPAETKSYQLVGEFKEDLAALGGGFDFMLNLNEDGTAVLARYNPFTYNGDDAATNSAYEAEYMKGTWKEAEKDGVECLQIKLAVYQKDGTTVNDTTSYAYDVAGVYSFDLNFPLVVGMSFSRTCTLSGGETKIYADANAFIQAKKLTFTEPTSVAKFYSVNENGEKTGGTVYVQEDGTVLAYAGYTEFATGTYAKSTSGDSITFALTMEGEKVEVTVEGTKVAFDYVYSMGGGYDTTYTFVCDDVTVIPDNEQSENTEVKYVGTYGENKYSITILSETECKYANEAYVSMGLSGFECTYVIADNGVITLTIKSEPTNPMLVGVWETMKAFTWTVNNKDNSMAVKYFGTAEGTTYSITMYNETECRYANETYVAMGLSGFDCTYVIADDGAITLTIKEEPTNAALVGIWSGMQVINWTIGENATMTVR